MFAFLQYRSRGRSAVEIWSCDWWNGLHQKSSQEAEALANEWELGRHIFASVKLVREVQVRRTLIFFIQNSVATIITQCEPKANLGRF